MQSMANQSISHHNESQSHIVSSIFHCTLCRFSLFSLFRGDEDDEEDEEEDDEEDEEEGDKPDHPLKKWSQLSESEHSTLLDECQQFLNTSKLELVTVNVLTDHAFSISKGHKNANALLVGGACLKKY